jgi:hypothetical protein
MAPKKSRTTIKPKSMSRTISISRQVKINMDSSMIPNRKNNEALAFIIFLASI